MILIVYYRLSQLKSLDLNIEKFGDFPKILKRLEKSRGMRRNMDLIEMKIDHLNRKLENNRHNYNKYVTNFKKITNSFNNAYKIEEKKERFFFLFQY